MKKTKMYILYCYLGFKKKVKLKVDDLWAAKCSIVISWVNFQLWNSWSLSFRPLMCFSQGSVPARMSQEGVTSSKHGGRQHCPYPGGSSGGWRGTEYNTTCPDEGLKVALFTSGQSLLTICHTRWTNWSHIWAQGEISIRFCAASNLLGAAFKA